MAKPKKAAVEGEVIDLTLQPNLAQPIERELSESTEEDPPEYTNARFRVKVPVEITLAFKTYVPGPVYEVDRGTMEMIMEMAERKRRADLAVFTGKNHLVERMLDRTLKITEVESLDRKRLIGG